jgi:hypothetical protein
MDGSDDEEDEEDGVDPCLVAVLAGRVACASLEPEAKEEAQVFLSKLKRKVKPVVVPCWNNCPERKAEEPVWPCVKCAKQCCEWCGCGSRSGDQLCDPCKNYEDKWEESEDEEEADKEVWINDTPVAELPKFVEPRYTCVECETAGLLIAEIEMRASDAEVVCLSCHENEKEENWFDGKYPEANCHRCEKKVKGSTVVYCNHEEGCETWYCADCHADNTDDCPLRDHCQQCNAIMKDDHEGWWCNEDGEAIGGDWYCAPCQERAGGMACPICDRSNGNFKCQTMSSSCCVCERIDFCDDCVTKKDEGWFPCSHDWEGGHNVCAECEKLDLGGQALARKAAHLKDEEVQAEFRQLVKDMKEYECTTVEGLLVKQVGILKKLESLDLFGDGKNAELKAEVSSAVSLFAEAEKAELKGMMSHYKAMSKKHDDEEIAKLKEAGLMNADGWMICSACDKFHRPDECGYDSEA